MNTKLFQRIQQLSLALNNPELTDDERDDIEGEIADLEYELEQLEKDHFNHNRNEQY